MIVIDITDMKDNIQQSTMVWKNNETIHILLTFFMSTPPPSPPLPIINVEKCYEIIPCLKIVLTTLDVGAGARTTEPHVTEARG